VTDETSVVTDPQDDQSTVQHLEHSEKTADEAAPAEASESTEAAAPEPEVSAGSMERAQSPEDIPQGDEEASAEEAVEEQNDADGAAEEAVEEQDDPEEAAEEEIAAEGAVAPILDPSLLQHEKKTDLKTSVGKQARNTGRNWYVIHTYSGYEDAVEKALRQRIDSLNMHDLIFDVIVPKESTITIKKGEHITEKKRLFPGYVLVEMIVTDESWYVVRNTPNVTGFVGSGTIPVPVKPEEFNVIQKHLKKEEPKFKIDFSVGEQIMVSDGPFKGYDGMVDAVDEKKGKLTVLVNIFGRETPVQLDFVQVKKK